MPSSEVGTSRKGLSRLRRIRGLKSASTISLNSTLDEDGDDGIEDTERRGSVDAMMGKLPGRKDRVASIASTKDDSGNDASPARKLTGLLSRKKRNAKQNMQGLDNVPSNDSDRAMAPNQSQPSLLFNESRRSSLMTSDESVDPDSSSVRPSLSRHESHTGYLTLSSPEINDQANTVDLDTIVRNSDSSPPPPLPVRPANIPLIIEPPDTTAPVPPANERSRSPTEKLKGAFSLDRKKSATESDSVHSAESGSGGLRKIFRSRNTSKQRGAAEEESDIQASASDDTGAEDLPRLAATQSEPSLAHLAVRPSVVTSSPTTPPDAFAALTTVVTPPTPTDLIASPDILRSQTPSTPAQHADSSERSRHRRGQSLNTSSKLSTAVYPPLSPTLEETKTPGGTLTQPHSGGGFFSSFFTAAQKAADQLTHSINSTSTPEPGALPLQAQSDGDKATSGPDNRPGTSSAGSGKPLTVENLGKSNSSLSHLGISDFSDSTSMTAAANLQQQNGQMKTNSSMQKAEEESAARAVSIAYEKPAPLAVSHSKAASISSVDRVGLGGDLTPPRSDLDAGGVKRSGSVRSKLGRRRHRGSSATTGNTIAAAIKDSAAGLANPAVNGAGHRLTGFAVASSKRNKEFHQLFRSVPEDDYLIEDYSAALQRDILLHGRLYVSEGHICFSSNILGWVTNLVISFDEITSVEKKSTAVIFPNALVISTLHARNTFASFVARDSTYELLIGIWKISHPNLKSSLNGVVLDDAGTGDRTELADTAGSDEGSDDESEDEVYDEDADDDAGSFTDAGLAASHVDSDADEGAISRKPSGAPVGSTSQPNGASPKGLENADAVVTGAGVSSDFPGPATHAPTECSEGAEHYAKPLIDTTIPAPLGKVYSMMYGPASGQFMRKWLVDDQKSRELNYNDDKIGMDNDHKTFVFDYIKPLSAPVGPKQTKCITTNTLLAFDLEKAVTVDCSTATPDVPSGSVFTVKTRYCLTWASGNSTRIVATSTVEWTGKSWLKGPIEKGANDGQISYVEDIVAALKAAVTTKPPVKGVAKKGKRKGKKEVFDAEEANNQREATVKAEKKSSNGGIFEPVMAILEPIGSLLQPLLSSQAIIGVLLVTVLYLWIRRPEGGSGISFPSHTSPERAAAFEEIWRREESALWDWLEDRAGLDNVYTSPLSSGQQERQQVLQAKKIGKKLNDERMTNRQMDDAIRTTEERLAALKDAVKRKSSQQTDV